jgi:hypothetical protein
MAREQISAAEEPRVVLELHEAALTFAKRLGADIGDAEARGIVDRARTYLRRSPGGNLSAANAQALGQVAGEVERIKAEETAGKRNITAAGGKADLLAGGGGRTGLGEELSSDGTRSKVAWRSSSDYDRALAADKAAEKNLSPALRKLIDPARGISGDDVFDAALFAQKLGLAPGPYAGYFIHASQGARETLSDFVLRGARIDGDKIRTAADVIATIGAMRSQGIDENDPNVPENVRRIIRDMKARGIDYKRADAQTMRDYFQDNPRALDQVREQTARYEDKAHNLSPQDLVERAKKASSSNQRVQPDPTREAETVRPSQPKKTSGFDV